MITLVAFINLQNSITKPTSHCLLSARVYQEVKEREGAGVGPARTLNAIHKAAEASSTPTQTNATVPANVHVLSTGCPSFWSPSLQLQMLSGKHTPLMSKASMQDPCLNHELLRVEKSRPPLCSLSSPP